ncbi:MAG: hypothetical protein VYA87_01660 [SAR324 cluster bacterium]|nr:hypothetical protein [SAR324 cluster bacterium]
MHYFKIKILFFTLLLFVLAVSCADIDTESSGYASLNINLDDVSKRKTGRSTLAPSMTSSDAKTILAVLVPAVQCDKSSASSSVEYSRALIDIQNLEAQFVVPIDTNVKLCLYFFRDTFSLNELAGGTNSADGFGESGVFSIDSETTAKTIAVEFWTTSYSTVTLKISSSSSAGMLEGSSGTVKLNSTSGQLMDNQSFTITAEDNTSKSVVFSDVVYNSYSYDVELTGYIPLTQAFLVSSSTETLDVKLTPNMVELDWLSFDNMSIAQEGTSSYAKAGGTLVLNVPNEQNDNITQMLSLMQVKRVGLSNLVDVTPPIALSSWSKSEGSDNVTYTTLFSTANPLSLDHGPNEFQVMLTVNDESKTQSMGTVDYDACVDNSTMCLTLSWTDGLDPDLHSYYFPDWAYNEEITNGSFDNTSRGTRHWIYSNAANKKYSETGQVIQLQDGNTDNETEVQVWATDSQKVGNGTYLVYVEDVSEVDVQNFTLVLSGPGTDNKTYGPYDLKDDDNNSTTEALNPQAVFFIQVDNNSIVRSDNITIGDNLSSTLMQWTGTLQNSVVE